MKSPFIFILTVLLCTSALPKESSRKALLPKSSEVKSIEVKIDQTPDGKIPKKKGFTISKDFDAVLAAFSPNTVDPKPSKWEIGGRMTINTNDGKSMKVYFYWPGNGPLAFKVNGAYYRGGSIKALTDVIKKHTP